LVAPQCQSSDVEDYREADEDGGEAGYEALPEVGWWVEESLREDSCRQAEHPGGEEGVGVFEAISQ
jgi:hypothetical protein